MKFLSFSALVAATLLFGSCSSSSSSMHSGKTVMVGGAAMYPTKNIVQNAMNSQDHTTLVAAVQAAGLAPTLEGAGPFTVFAPTNEAFNMLPTGSVDLLVKPYNKTTLTDILTYHVVPGTYSTADMDRLIHAGKGTATLTSVSGHKLTLTRHGGSIWITDEHGGSAAITTSNVFQSNGVIQVVDHVLVPTLI